MFHLASTIVGGRDLIEEFVAAKIWPISHGWAPREIVSFNINWATQEVPFPRFGLQLTDDQSAEDFMNEVEKKVNTMIGQYTMNEYKAYKNLVKHKKKINRVFSLICGAKSFPSRRPGPPVKMPCVAVASCSAAPLKALRKKSSKKNQGTPDEATSSGVQPMKTKSLESTKRKRRTSEQISDVELQAASSLAQMSRKKAKKAVKKTVTAEVRQVPFAFDDDLFVESIQKGSFFWTLLRFNFRAPCPSGSENEFMDIDSFSDAAPEFQKEVISGTAAKPPAATTDTVVSQPAGPQDEASPEFTKELELTIHRGDNPVPDAPLVEVREALPEGRDPSPSVAAFNKNFGTSHRGELLSVGCEVARNKGGTPRILTLWKSSALIDETREEGSEQSLHLLGGAVGDSRKEPRSSLRKTSAPLGKSSSSSGKKVTVQNLSKQGSSLFANSWASRLTIPCL
jgi:hypothetical protein